MKKTIITYGFIAGAIVTAMMIYSTYSCYTDPNFKPGEIFGYAGMLVAFTFIFIGIKNFRDKQNEGVITFGKAFKIGAFIALIAATCYVSVWLVEYYVFFPDFMEKFTASALKQAQESGLSEAALTAKKEEMAMYVEWYKNPLLVVLMTYAEILPLGLIIALISALILKKKHTVTQ